MIYKEIQVVWRYRGKEITRKTQRPSSGDYRLNRWALEVEDAVGSDSGMYSCEVSEHLLSHFIMGEIIGMEHCWQHSTSLQCDSHQSNEKSSIYCAKCSSESNGTCLVLNHNVFLHIFVGECERHCGIPLPGFLRSDALHYVGPNQQSQWKLLLL